MKMLFLSSCLLFAHGIFGQSQANTGFSSLSDVNIRNEMAQFTQTGATATSPTANETLRNIPLTHSSKTGAHFADSRFFKGGTYVTLYASPAGENAAQSRVDSVFFVLHSHYTVDFPYAAFDGISVVFPGYTAPRKREKSTQAAPVAPRLLQSADGHRLYLYLRNTSAETPFEVTWIVENGTYHGRVWDTLPGTR